MNVVIENASVVGLANEQVTMQNGDQRQKQIVTLCVNSGRGVELYGAEVWDDSVEKFALQIGETVAVSCRLVGRLNNGRWFYNLVAFNVGRDAVKAEQIF